MTNDDIVPQFDAEKNEKLKIGLQNVPDVESCLILILNGYIDTYNSNYFQKQVQLAIETGFIRLIFNCNDLHYVSSTGIGSFTAFLKAVKPKGGDVVLLNIQQKVYEVFQLLGFSHFFNVKDTLDSAIGFFRGDTTGQNSAIFPKIFPCPTCSKTLKAVKFGRFCCSDCKTIITVGNNGEVSLG